MRLGLKILMVLGLTVAILLPLMLIRGTIQERQEYRNQAVQSVARSYAGPQGVVGPVLVVPYVETLEVEEKDAQGVVRKVRQEEERYWTFFPASLDVAGDLHPSTRKLGLHEVRVYELKAALSARFDATIPDDTGTVVPRRIGEPWLSYGFQDVRGLTGTPRLRIGGRDARLKQGTGRNGGSGMHVRLAPPRAGTVFAFESRLDFVLGGTEALAIAPLGARNRIVIDSSWRHPQFNGDFLPRTRRIDAKGFHAVWEISSLATNAQAQYLAGNAIAHDGVSMGKDAGSETGGLDRIGISLVDPVNIYSQADRASKYGLLFVLLTFVGFFMFELIKQLRVHPIQYALVGLALAIFFLLLVALSEHIAFGWAYLIASGACIGLLGFYLGYVLRSRLRGIGFAAMLATLYGALFGLLVSEDNALVLGAGLLFLILAAIMVVTRKIDWYQLSANANALRG